MADRPRSKLDLHVTPPPRLDRRDSRIPNVDVDKLQTAIDKIATAVNRSARHTEQIPEIKRKVEDTGVKVVELDTKMTTATERISRVENKVDEGHPCQKEDVISELKESQRDTSQKIETDVQKGVKQSGEIATLKTDVNDIKRVPRKLFFSFIVTLLTLGGGSIWFLAELSNDVEHERELRQEQFKRIETQLESVGNKSDNTPVRNAIEELEDEIEESGGYEKQYNQMCSGMTYHERRFMRKLLKKQGRDFPISCLEQ